MSWTAKQLARVHAFQRPEKAPPPVDPAERLAEVRRRFPRVKRLDSDTPPAVVSAVARYVNGKDAAHLDLDTEGAAAAILGGSEAMDAYDRLEPLIDLWVATEGPAFALAALLASGELDIQYQGNTLFIREPTSSHFYFVSGFVGAWRRLRERLLEVDEAAYAAARTWAARLRKDADQVVRTILAYTFPLETTWARAEAKEKAKQPRARYGDHAVAIHPMHRVALVSSLDDASLLAGLLSSDHWMRSNAWSHDHLLTAFVRLGPAAATLAPTLTDKASVQERLELASLLSGLEGLDVARALVALFGEARVTKAARVGLGRDPRSAIAALAEALAESPRRAKLYAPALSAIAARHPAIAAEIAPSLGPAAQKVLAPWAKDEDLLTPALAKAAGAASTKKKAPGPWLDAVALPAIALRDGKPMPDADRTKLLGALAKAKLGGAVAAEVRAAREACDPGSLEAFGLALLEQWVRGCAPARDTWAAAAASALAGDATPRRLAQYARSWGRARASPAMTVALDALAAVPSDATLRQLSILTASSGELLEAAQGHLDRLVKKRGLGEEDLLDRLVPDCSLGRGRDIVLDFGARTFSVTFDDHLVPQLADASGARLKSLPRPSKKDDPVKAEGAVERWDEIKSTLRETMKSESKRFEHAMRSRRRWTPASFQEAIIAHPVLGRIAQRVIWASYEGGDHKPLCFRVAEDLTFADVQDDAVTVRGPIGIPHPVDLDAGERTAWAQVLGDYALTQPFAQMGREVYTPSDDERDGREVRRLAGVLLEKRAYYILEAKGWVRPYDWGSSSMVRELDGGDGAATIELRDEGDKVRIEEVTIDGGTLGKLDPIAFSELVSDVERARI